MGAKHEAGSATTSTSVLLPCRDSGAVRVRAASDGAPSWSWHTTRARRSGDGLKPSARMMRPFTPTITNARSFPKGRMETKPRLTSQVAVDAAKPAICWFAMLPRSVDVKRSEYAAADGTGSAQSDPAAHRASSTRRMIDPSRVPIVRRSGTLAGYSARSIRDNPSAWKRSVSYSRAAVGLAGTRSLPASDGSRGATDALLEIGRAHV